MRTSGENFSRLTWLDLQDPVAYHKVGNPRRLSIGLARYCAIASKSSFSERKEKGGGGRLHSRLVVGQESLERKRRVRSRGLSRSTRRYTGRQKACGVVGLSTTVGLTQYINIIT